MSRMKRRKKNMKNSRNKKAEELLKESKDWENGKRGKKSAPATADEEKELESRLNLHLISIRLPTYVVEELKREAAKKGLKYQPYVRQILINHVEGTSSLEERVRRLEEKFLKVGP